MAQHGAQLAHLEQVEDALVQQTAACCGSRPVAKALGVSVGAM